MSWLHSQQSNFVFTIPILMEVTVRVCVYNIYSINIKY